MNLIRYAVQMRNGNFMVQEFLEGLDKVEITVTDLPIDADLFKKKDVAERAIKETLSGGGNLPVFYDGDNPPEKVVEVHMNFTLKD